MTKYNVGDKVRILDASRILGLQAETGAVLDVVSLDAFGDPRVRDVGGGTQCFYKDELRYIEKVSDKPTKNQRITTLEQNVITLESQVSELQAEVAALKKAKATPKFEAVTTDNIAVGDKIRVIDSDGIGPAVLTNGKVYEVELLCTDGDFYVTDDEGDRMSIVESEFPYVEKVVSE